LNDAEESALDDARTALGSQSIALRSRYAEATHVSILVGLLINQGREDQRWYLISIAMTMAAMILPTSSPAHQRRSHRLDHSK